MLPVLLTSCVFSSVAAVEGLSVKVVNATALLAQWTALELETLSISFYTVYYGTFSEEQNQTAVALRSVPNDTTSFLLDVRDLTPGLQHQFRVTASVDIEGEVIEGEASEYAIVFGKLVSHSVR